MADKNINFSKFLLSFAGSDAGYQRWISGKIFD